MRPAATRIVSVPSRRHAAAPLIGLVRVGDVTASRPTSRAIALMRAEWYGSETRTTRVNFRSFRKRADADNDSHDDRPLVSRRIALSGTPRRCRYVAAAVASVKRSPAWRPPVTTIFGAMWSWYSSYAWSSRAASTLDGRPSYCAAPSTTIASDGRASSRRDAIHTCTKVTAR